MAQRPRAIVQLHQLEDRTTPNSTTATIIANAPYLPGYLIAGLQPGQEQVALAAVRGSSLVSSVTPLAFGAYHIALTPGVAVPYAMTAIGTVPGVRYAEPDYLRTKADTVPNDPSFTDGTLWGLRNLGQDGGTPGADIRAVKGWDLGTGNRTHVVAVVDDGFDYTHPDLAANAWVNPGEIPGNGVDDDGNGIVDDIHGAAFDDSTTGTGDPMPTAGNNHGTHVSGTVGAVGNNGVGVTGVNWNTRIMGVNFLGSGQFSGAISAEVLALDYARRMGATIINGSFGGFGTNQAERDAFAALQAAGIIAVVAAGNDANDNDTLPYYPANFSTEFDNVITIAAVDRNDQMADFSSYGLQSVTLGAPGVAILSTIHDGQGYDTFDGTSMATPHVAGAISLFWDANPDLSYQEVLQALKSSVRPLPSLSGNVSTGGTLNLEALMSMGGSGVMVTGADAGGGPHVKVFTGGGRLLASFFAYDANFTGGVRVATGDVNGDRTPDIITVAGPSGGPHVKVFDGQTFQEIFSFYAFESTFTGGLTVAAGDVNGDGRADIIIGADKGGGPRVSVFSLPIGGTTLARIADFYAYDPNFSGGVRVAAGLFSAASTQADIVVAPGAGGGPHVRRFNAASVLAYRPVVSAETMVGDPNSRTGLYVAAGDMDGDGLADVAAGVGSGTPIVTILNGQTFAPIASFRNPVGGELPGLVNPNNPYAIGSSFTPVLNNGLLPPGSNPDALIPENSNVKPGTTYGVRVAIMDANGDQRPDLVLSGGPGDAPTVTIVSGTTLTPARAFSAYASSFFGGVFVGAPGV